MACEVCSTFVRLHLFASTAVADVGIWWDQLSTTIHHTLDIGRRRLPSRPANYTHTHARARHRCHNVSAGFCRQSIRLLNHRISQLSMMTSISEH